MKVDVHAVSRMEMASFQCVEFKIKDQFISLFSSGVEVDFAIRKGKDKRRGLIKFINLNFLPKKFKKIKFLLPNIAI